MTKRLFSVPAIIAIIIGARFDFFIERPVTALAQTNTFCAANLACTVSASWTFTGPFTTKNLWAEVYAASFAGATCGDKINSAVASVPTNGLIVDVNQACGPSTPTTPWAAVTVNASNVAIKFVEPGIYYHSGITFLGAGNLNSGLYSSTPCTRQGVASAQNCNVQLTLGNGLNKSAAVTLADAGGYIRDLIIDCNKANNPTGGVGILVTGGNVTLPVGVTVQNCPTHGLWIDSLIANGAQQINLAGFSSANNNADGVYSLGAGDGSLGSGFAIEQNGITATVNTTSTLITATSGSWSTDSSLVGTMVRVNNTGMCQILGVPSTTTLTVAAATCWNASGVPTGLGTQTGVPFAMGNGIESNNSPTMRINQGDCGNNRMDCFLAYGTSTGLGSNKHELGGMTQMGNQGNHDIEIIGSCLDNQVLSCSIQNIFGTIGFIGSQRRALINTFDMVKLVDGGQNIIQPNAVAFSTGANQEKAFVEQVESAGSRATLQNVVSFNTQPQNSAGTATYIDSTVLGTFGSQLALRCGSSSSLDLFNVTTGASTPHKFLCVDSSGNFIVQNNAFSQDLNLSDSGILRVSTLQASFGNACTNGELVLSAGWGTTATVTAVHQNGGQACSWTLTSSGTGQAANPTVTDTLTNTMFGSPICDMTMHGGTGANTLFNQTTFSGTVPAWTFGGTPVAAATYIVTRVCFP